MLRNQNVSSAIVGASRPEQIAENVKALDVELEPDFVEAIEAALAPTTLFDPGFTFSPSAETPLRLTAGREAGGEPAHLERRVRAVLLEDAHVAGVRDAPALVVSR